MKKIMIFFIILALISSSYQLYSATSKTVYGDCNSKDKKLWFKSETYTDHNDDAKWDYFVTGSCIDSITTYKYSYSGEKPISDIGDKLHQLNNFEYDSNGNESFEFYIRDSVNSPIIGIEEKSFSSDTVFFTNFENLFLNVIPEHQKLQSFVKYIPERKEIYLQYYCGNEVFYVVEFLNSENDIIKKFKIKNNLKNAWNIQHYKINLKNDHISSVRIKSDEDTQYYAPLK